MERCFFLLPINLHAAGGVSDAARSALAACCSQERRLRCQASLGEWTFASSLQGSSTDAPFSSCMHLGVTEPSKQNMKNSILILIPFLFLS